MIWFDLTFRIRTGNITIMGKEYEEKDKI